MSTNLYLTHITLCMKPISAYNARGCACTLHTLHSSHETPVIGPFR